MADITTNHTYRIIYINIYPEFWNNDKESQCKCLLHELSHTITEDMHDDWHNMYKGTFVTEAEANHHRERATEQIAYLIFQL
jgi:hypothetical protein